MCATGHPKQAVLNVRFGSKADIQAPSSDVRFTPKSGHDRINCEVVLDFHSRTYRRKINVYLGLQII